MPSLAMIQPSVPAIVWLRTRDLLRSFPIFLPFLSALSAPPPRHVSAKVPRSRRPRRLRRRFPFFLAASIHKPPVALGSNDDGSDNLPTPATIHGPPACLTVIDTMATPLRSIRHCATLLLLSLPWLYPGTYWRHVRWSSVDGFSTISSPTAIPRTVQSFSSSIGSQPPKDSLEASSEAATSSARPHASHSVTPDPSPTCSTRLSGRTVSSPAPPAAYPSGFLFCRSSTASVSGRLSPGLLGRAASCTAAADHHRRPLAFDCHTPPPSPYFAWIAPQLLCEAMATLAPAPIPRPATTQGASASARLTSSRTPMQPMAAPTASPRCNHSCSLLQRLHPVFSSARWCGASTTARSTFLPGATEDEVEPPNGRNF
ncbi:hypothetical protein EJB05_51654 [Eragrostis curvula]|uniref:Uncharacterized protein n=1 Tax=Eragrostis curvula TaxID=38414 RepID=A0A5J9SV64_9POAL|nr:hypothetical protein EJB05_51654 [Eragrostis curvula]